MELIEIGTVVFLGLVLGSFATALSWRLPRGESIVTKVHSGCPSCGHNLGARDLVPVFSWLCLRGKCRYCKAAIGIRYPLIELATLALCLLFYAVYGLSLESAMIFLLAPLLVAIIDIDIHHKIIPDTLNLSVFMTGVVALLVNAFVYADPPIFLSEQGMTAALGCVMYGAGSWLLRAGMHRALGREPMGLGDVKFFAAIGPWLGTNPEAVCAVMLISGTAGTVMALAWQKLRGEAEFPFGPAIVVAFIGALCLYPPAFILS